MAALQSPNQEPEQPLSTLPADTRASMETSYWAETIALCDQI